MSTQIDRIRWARVGEVRESEGCAYERYQIRYRSRHEHGLYKSPHFGFAHFTGYVLMNVSVWYGLIRLDGISHRLPAPLPAR